MARTPEHLPRPRHRAAVLVALGLLLSAPTLAPADPAPTSTVSEDAVEDLPEIDERLRAEEAWAAKEDRRRRRAKAGEPVEPPTPPPGRSDPVPAWLLVVVGVGAGAAWGWWHRTRKRRR